MVVLEKELWVEMINMLWSICLFLCVCTGWGGIVSSRFVEICIIVTDTDSFPHKRIILQCSLLLWFFHPPCKWSMAYTFLLPLLSLGVLIVLVKRIWVGMMYGICTQTVERLGWITSLVCFSLFWFCALSQEQGISNWSCSFTTGPRLAQWGRSQVEQTHSQHK